MFESDVTIYGKHAKFLKSLAKKKISATAITAAWIPTQRFLKDTLTFI